MSEEGREDEYVATGPDPECEACGVDELWSKSVQEKVESEVGKRKDGACGVEESETPCAKDCSATTVMKELAE